MALSKEEAQDLLNNEEKLKAKVVQIISAMSQIAFSRNDYEMIRVLTWTSQEEWLGYARNNLKKKVEV